MVPTTWLTLASFLLLVAPGILFDLLAALRTPGRTESTFREISRVVLASFGFSALGLAVVAFVRAFWPEAMPDPRRLILEGNKYIAYHYALLIGAFALDAVVALGTVYLIHLRLRPKDAPSLRAESVWSAVFRRGRPSHAYVPYARVRTSDGYVYQGFVGEFTADLDQEQRELVLHPPLGSKRATDSSMSAVPVEWQRIILPASNIASITIQYRPRPS